MRQKEVAAVILAAGAGTRMKSELPKVLHPVCGVPMLGHVLSAVGALGIRDTYVIVGHLRKQVGAYIKNFDRRAEAVTQWPPRGTGHALLQTRKQLRSYCGSVLVLCGDAPLIRKSSLESLIRTRHAKDASCVVLTFKLEDPTGYGRIVRDARGKVVRIVEQLNATPDEKAIREVNSGIYCFDAKALYKALDRVKPDPIKKEIYLTDAVGILAAEGGVEAIVTDTPEETLGVNTRKDLALVTKIRKTAILDRLMSAGVTIEDPATTFIGEGVKIGADTVIHPNTVIDGPAVIGRKCSIGPFAHIRAGVKLGDQVTVGNFVEVVRSTVGDRTLVKHLTYLGDTQVGSDTNIGAGTITANFDGKNKHRTVIGRGVKVGSGTVIVAPAALGDKAVTGAGAVVTRGTRVKPGQTVVGVPARPASKKKV
ncbi:MAG: NTP transferase domain-containing protein [Candidatus Omnitrophica bacterium]|nr:NTP transferase domain-containing protein [Candidatus Omnitrophota bacterium]